MTRIEVLSSVQLNGNETSIKQDPESDNANPSSSPQIMFASSTSSSSQTFADVIQKVNDERDHFLGLLRLEIEKVSLFALARQGVLADAVGALIFNTDSSFRDGGNDSPNTMGTRRKRQDRPMLQIIHHDLGSAFRRF